MNPYRVIVRTPNGAEWSRYTYAADQASAESWIYDRKARSGDCVPEKGDLVIAERMVPMWAVHYDYDGGASGAVFTFAEDPETAGKQVMAKATPRYASDPKTPCHLKTVYRVMYINELLVLPHAGVQEAVELSWDLRDTGGKFLVVERGSRLHDGFEYWTAVGRIVGSYSSQAACDKLVRQIKERTRGYNGRYDVVPRDAVTIKVSEANYGTNTGDCAA